jgi:hypothetical protein
MRLRVVLRDKLLRMGKKQKLLKGLCKQSRNEGPRKGMNDLLTKVKLLPDLQRSPEPKLLNQVRFLRLILVALL